MPTSNSHLRGFLWWECKFNWCQGMVPSVFAQRHSKWDSPWVAILASYVPTLALISFSFNSILCLDNILSCIATIIMFLAAASLRVHLPDLPRPYRVPLGTWGFCGMLVLPMGIVLYIVYEGLSKSWFHFGLTLGVSIFGVLLYCLMNSSRDRKWCACWEEKEQQQTPILKGTILPTETPLLPHQKNVSQSPESATGFSH